MLFQQGRATAVFRTHEPPSAHDLRASCCTMIHNSLPRLLCPAGYPPPPGAPPGTQGCCPAMCLPPYPFLCPAGTPGVQPGVPSCCALLQCPYLQTGNGLQPMMACPPGLPEASGLSGRERAFLKVLSKQFLMKNIHRYRHSVFTRCILCKNSGKIAC